MQQPASCDPAHRPRVRGGPHAPDRWENHPPGWFSGISQRPAHAQGRLCNRAGQTQPGKLRVRPPGESSNG
eukprot:6931071-Heterocapsa_arctica.AAC.1